MDERVKRLTTPQECEIFAVNATERGHPELALQARQYSVELCAIAYGASNDAERECLMAIYAYEEILFAKHGKRVRATRTWQMIQRRGIIAAIEQAVDRADSAAGFTALQEIGLDNYSFEAVILKHPDLFSESAVLRSQQRMELLQAAAQV